MYLDNCVISQESWKSRPTYLPDKALLTLNIVLLAWFCSTQQQRPYIVNDSSGLIRFLMCFFLCPATESDRMSESGGYLRFDNFFNCLHFNGNHHQLKTYGEFLLFL